MQDSRQNAAENVVPYLAFSRRRVYVKQHDMPGNPHFDLRLEYEGILRSWALRQGMSYYPGDRYEAIEVDDHRKEYGKFEGVHPTGTIMLWDLGLWEPEPDCIDINACLRKGVLRFTLYGEKLKGGWTLTKTSRQTKSGRTIWMVSKNLDSFARSKDALSIMEEAPYSVASGLSMEEIRRTWGISKKKPRSESTLFEL